MLDLATIQGARRTTLPARFVPMLASLPEGDFARPGWIFEPKLDGMRALAMVSGNTCRLLSRRMLDITNQYPGLAAELPSLLNCDALLDGEIIALNEQGRPSFQHLQQRMNLSRLADISRAELAVPVYYFVFDIAYADGFDLCGVKLAERKLILNDKLRQSDRVKILSYFSDDGVIAYEACVENGFEGIVAKRLDSLYEPGRRSNNWLKVKAQQTDEFVVGGFTHGQGSRRPTFGALLLGAFDEAGKFVYCGSVGSGFDERLLYEAVRRMEPLKQSKHPFLKRPDEKKEVTWLKPEIVVEVKFMDWTRDYHLRTPVFLRFRDDKAADEVRLNRKGPSALLPVKISLAEKSAAEKIRRTRIEPNESKPVKPAVDCNPGPEARRGAPLKKDHSQAGDPSGALSLASAFDMARQIAASKGDRAEIVVEGDVIELPHLDKIMWTASSGLPRRTKRDFLYYVACVAPFLLAYLKDRPLSVVRSPDGMKGKSFYQKHWNFQVPDFVETFFLNNEEDEVATCSNFASLLWYAAHGVMEFHAWLSRIGFESVDREGNYPDFMVFDIDCHLREDKKEKRPYRQDLFLKVSEVAVYLHEALLAASLVPFLKTSGRNGLHVFVPITTNLTHSEVRILAETVARFIAGKHAGLVTLDAVAAKQSGKVLLDCGPNCRGKTLIAPYSPRLVAEQTISAPLQWSELGQVCPVEFTMESMPERLEAVGDLWSGWADHKSDLQDIFNTRPAVK